MNVFDSITNRRTIRKYDQSKRVPSEILLNAVECARLSPSGGNFQSLKFAVIEDPRIVEDIFYITKWGMHLPDGSGTPQEGEHPTAFIAILHDKDISKNLPANDAGAAAQSMMVYAWSEGVGSCWIGNIDRKKARDIMDLPENLEIHTVIAFGYPAMTAHVEDLKGEDTKYFYRGEDFIVPKRKLEDILLHYK